MLSNMSKPPHSERAKAPEIKGPQQLAADDGADSESGPESAGTNLKVLYGALAFALALAIGLALLIVLPFYHRR
jgi:hypothetical protein